MRFLVDQNLSPLLAAELRNAGHDVAHTRDLGLSTAIDDIILKRALDDDRVLISADTDFGLLLAESGADRPSFVLLRLRSPRPAARLAAVVLANLPGVSSDLESGAVVVLEDERIRVRRLAPLGGRHQGVESLLEVSAPREPSAGDEGDAVASELDLVVGGVGVLPPQTGTGHANPRLVEVEGHAQSPGRITILHASSLMAAGRPTFVCSPGAWAIRRAHKAGGLGPVGSSAMGGGLRFRTPGER